MKNYFWSALLMLAISFVAMSQTQGISIKYNGYGIAVPITLQGYADADLAPMVAGKIDSLSKKALQSRFGILFRDDAKNLSGVTVLELLDAATNKVIRKINLEEYFGTENSSWKRDPDESKVSASSSIEVYRFTVNEKELKFVKEIALVADEALPGGKKLELSFALLSQSALNIKARVYGRVEGTLVKFANGFSISNAEPLSSLKPAILFHILTPTAVTIETAKKDKEQNLTLSGNQVSIKANQKTKLFSFDIVGSSVSFANYVPKQIENVNNYLSGRKALPSVVIVPVPDKQKTIPGDTLGYSIYYHNIGTAPATDIHVTGIIPSGTKYLNGSAEGKGTAISFNRAEGAPPATGEITTIKWIDKTIIKSGEERCVRYKVVIR